MKYRESGMPEEGMWNTFFKPEDILPAMEINEHIEGYVDIGCGYGTFLIPASKMVKKQLVSILMK